MTRPVSLCICGSHAWVPLTKGYVTMVSPDDADALRTASWRAMVTRGGHVYARRNGKKINRVPTCLLLHREILSLDSGEVADHVNRNTLDNTRENLRPASRAENNRNRIGNRKSEYKGVSFDPRSDRYFARIGGKHIGSFGTPEEAARAYDDASLRMWGKFARPNFLPTPTPEREAS